MLYPVAQLTGQLNKGSRMAKFQTILYLFGLLVGNPAIYFVLISNGEALLMGEYRWVAGKSKGLTPPEMQIILVIHIFPLLKYQRPIC